MAENPEITSLWADRLQRFIPDRENAEGMARALQDDLEECGYWIGGPYGIRVITGKRVCPVCDQPLEQGDSVVVTGRRWWEFWKFRETIHARCADAEP